MESELDLVILANNLDATRSSLSIMRGARDMLRECAKQFRAMGMPDGHAKMADAHADELEKVIG